MTLEAQSPLVACRAIWEDRKVAPEALEALDQGSCTNVSFYMMHIFYIMNTYTLRSARRCWRWGVRSVGLGILG